MGKKDDELYIRWLQLGVFSPIMRLHSTNNEFMGKEPWNYCGPIERIAKENLRLRHKLLPYIYTMNYRTHTECRAICEPMYYAYPERKSAYECKNQFFFGTELIVAPVTEHTSTDNNMAGVNVWIPEGRYTDVFTGRIYSGKRFVKMYRDIENIPVLAKAGAIIPMSANGLDNDCSNPEALELLVYRGNNTFTLYEDDGETLSYQNGAYLKTPFTVKEDGSAVSFTIGKGEGDISVVPEKRSYKIFFKDIVTGDITLKVNGKKKTVKTADCCGTLTVVTDGITAEDTVEILIENCEYLANKDKKQELTETIAKFQMGNDKKGLLFTEFLKTEKPLPPMAENFSGPIEEILALYRG